MKDDPDDYRLILLGHVRIFRLQKVKEHPVQSSQKLGCWDEKAKHVSTCQGQHCYGDVI